MVATMKNAIFWDVPSLLILVTLTMEAMFP
jgi:hypothetical protein